MTLLDRYRDVVRALVPAPGRRSVAAPDAPAALRAEQISAGQRNPVFRVWPGGLGDETTLIVKFYTPEQDRFFDHHFRREEKVLDLLNRWFAGRVPRMHGGCLVSGQLALLVMEDAGPTSLDVRLSETAGAEHRELAACGVDLLCGFHQVTREHYQPFYRTCQSIDLDRLNAPTFARRVAVALGRIRQLHLRLAGEDAASGVDPGDLARDVAPPAFFLAFRRGVVAPLLQAPRSIVHNSFSPLHILLDDGARLIDFETVAVGAAQIDLAELLEAPCVRLDEAERLALVERYFRAQPGRGRWRDFIRAYYCAAAARSLDYAGTTALRHAQFGARNSPAEAEAALRRHEAYLRRAAHALREIRLAALAETVEELLAQGEAAGVRAAPARPPAPASATQS